MQFKEHFNSLDIISLSTIIAVEREALLLLSFSLRDGEHSAFFLSEEWPFNRTYLANI